MSRFVRIFLKSSLVAAFAVHLWGQQADTAILVGSVTDPSKAVISGASVTLNHVQTNTTSSVTTDERGQFRTPPLRIGEYAVTIEAAGFKRSAQRGIVLNLGDVRALDVALQVGEVSESVNVEAAAPILQTADSTVGTVINNKQIQELPLNGRDYLQLAALSSGTVPSSQGVSIGGQAGTQAAFLLDGLDNNNQQISTGHTGQKEIIKPSVDAIEEFKVVTNGYSAEYGRSSSGVISVAIKSGTNDIHGTAYEFLRNEALDAKNYFATYKSPYKRNQFGAAVGGPVIRNKTFIFGDFEIGRIRQSATIVDTVPTLLQRQGIFGSTQLPASSIDPIAAKVLNYYPLPTNSQATNNFIYASPQISDPRRWDFRVDHVLSDSHNVYFRASSQRQDDGVNFGSISGILPPVNGNYVNGGGLQTTDSRSFVLADNKVWSPTIVTSIRAGWNYLQWYNTVPDQAIKGIGIPGVSTAYPGFSQLAITGYTSIGITNVPNSDASQDRQLSGDLTWTKGPHTFKFGVQANWLQTNFLSSQRSSGIFSFNGQYSGNAFQDFLLGQASSASLSTWSYLALRTPYKHFFLQDDWKVSRRLTLNIGLRYELSPPALQKNDTIGNFDLDTNPGHPQLVLAGAQGSDRASRALMDVNYHQFAPRIGFAYSLPDGKTVIRGGYGLFYSNLITLGGQQSMEVNPPNALRVNLSTDKTKAPTILLANGFAANTLSLANATNVTLISYDRSNVAPLAQQWNLNIQHQFGGGVLLEVGYNGNKFDHNWRQLDGNPAPPIAGNINSNRLYTTAIVPPSGSVISLADVVRIQKDGYSRYNALQVKTEKRFSRGMTFIASYSFSKTLALGDSSGVQNQLNWAADRAVSGQDVTHRVVASVVYAVPFGRGRSFGAHSNSVVNAVLGGWSVGPIFSANTGIPLNITVNGNPSNTGSGVDRPNVVGDWRLDNPTVQQWFNTAAFVANPKYTYGNAGRNIIRAPGVLNLDLSANKTFRLTERFSAQLRLESFNSLNHPQLGAPNTVLGSQSFGQISTAATPRDNQIGLKIRF